MCAMTKDQINASLFDEVKKLQAEKYELTQAEIKKVGAEWYDIGFQQGLAAAIKGGCSSFGWCWKEKFGE